MEGQETFLVPASNNNKNIAEEKYSEKEAVVEQISVERSPPTSFVPEVITFVLNLVLPLNIILTTVKYY